MNFKSFYLQESLESLPQYVYHQTGIENATSILKDGFIEGHDSGKGEKSKNVYFMTTPWKVGDYSCGSKKSVFVQVDISKLNLVDMDTLDDKNIPAHKRMRYFIKDSTMPIPKEYDGVYSRDHKGNLYEIILKKDVANKNITGKLFNRLGQIKTDK